MGRGSTHGRGKSQPLYPSNSLGTCDAQAVADLERRITDLETEKRQAETDITAAFSLGKHQEGRRLANRLAQVSRMLQELYEEWESTAK